VRYAPRGAARYDIRSFEEDGTDIFIEVKTTTGPAGAAFSVTANEIQRSIERGAAYRLYRIFQFGTCGSSKFRLGEGTRYRRPRDLGQTLCQAGRVWQLEPRCLLPSQVS
jgi:hypothetical protein